MTYQQLQDEVIALRFDESRRASVKSWLNLGYATLWNEADWHFKHVKGASLAVTGGDNTPTMPSDFAKSEGLYDDSGYPLVYLTPDEWRQNYLPSPTTTGTGSAYTVIDREIYIGPTPSSSVSYTLSYLRRLSHVDGPSGLAAAGVMVNDTDQPYWEAEYDYILVLQAAVLGGDLLGDLDTQAISQRRDEMLAAMKEDLVGGEEDEYVGFWGTPTWGSSWR